MQAVINLFVESEKLANSLEHYRPGYSTPITEWVLFGKPIVQWTDDDIETAVRVYRDVYVKAREE